MVITIVNIPNTKKFEDLPDNVRFKRNRIEDFIKGARMK